MQALDHPDRYAYQHPNLVHWRIKIHFGDFARRHLRRLLQTLTPASYIPLSLICRYVESRIAVVND
jgi:hypothetical protein